MPPSGKLAIAALLMGTSYSVASVAVWALAASLSDFLPPLGLGLRLGRPLTGSLASGSCAVSFSLLSPFVVSASYRQKVLLTATDWTESRAVRRAGHICAVHKSSKRHGSGNAVDMQIMPIVLHTGTQDVLGFKLPIVWNMRKRALQFTILTQNPLLQWSKAQSTPHRATKMVSCKSTNIESSKTRSHPGKSASLTQLTAPPNPGVQCRG